MGGTRKKDSVYGVQVWWTNTGENDINPQVSSTNMGHEGNTFVCGKLILGGDAARSGEKYGGVRDKSMPRWHHDWPVRGKNNGKVKGLVLGGQHVE